MRNLRPAKVRFTPHEGESPCGAPDDRWDGDDLHNLDQVTAADFEVVQMNPIYTQSNLPAGAVPAIASFTATQRPLPPART